MNARQLNKLGVPEHCVSDAILLVQAIAKHNRSVPKDQRYDIKALIEGLVLNTSALSNNALAEKFFSFYPNLDAEIRVFAKSLVEDANFVAPDPVPYKVWGQDDIEEGAMDQMTQACHVPVAACAALMPDAHVGYGLPIGGVLATENAVIPYAVGVDIACRMKMSIFDMAAGALEQDHMNSTFDEALDKGTRFGVGSNWTLSGRKNHNVMDDDRWYSTPLLKSLKDKAWIQLGTSGSGNHFAEFGILTLKDDDSELGLRRGRHLALMSHSGSRGPGAAVCSRYSGVAKAALPKRWQHLSTLGWLDMDSADGQEYWMAMNLMGDYAAANHDCIHRGIAKLLGVEIIAGVENHHNFAWKEMHGSKEVIVHRKGATPAGKGELGVIPGSMADPAYIVRGKGNPESLCSASHGAGRCMSRRQAKDRFNFKATQKNLAKRGIRIISAGADEVPGVYKNIRQVMAAQQDLVEIVGEFQPMVVKMCSDGSKPED